MRICYHVLTSNLGLVLVGKWMMLTLIVFSAIVPASEPWAKSWSSVIGLEGTSGV